MVTNFISEYKNAAPDDFCDRVIERLEYFLSPENKDTSGYMSGSISNEGSQFRNDHAYNFDINARDLCGEMHNYLHYCVKQYCEEHPSYDMINCISQYMKVQKTPKKGGFHMWHHEDGTQHGEMQSRKLTWTLYLNDIPDGEGETEFLEYGIKCKPEKGKIVLFPSAWTHTHRGNPVYTQDKYIATGWYYLA